MNENEKRPDTRSSAELLEAWKALRPSLATAHAIATQRIKDANEARAAYRLKSMEEGELRQAFLEALERENPAGRGWIFGGAEEPPPPPMPLSDIHG